jgi:hypothetical protein
MTTINSHRQSPNNDTKNSFSSNHVSLFNLDKANKLVDENENVVKRIQVENLLTFFIEAWIKVAIDYISISIFANECPVHVTPPAIDLDIFEINVFTGVG